MIYYHLFYGAKQIGRAQTRDQLLVIMLKLKDKEEHTGQGLSNVIHERFMRETSFSNRDDLILKMNFKSRIVCF